MNRTFALRKAFKEYVPYIIIVAIGVLFTFPLFSNIYNTGTSDWDYFCFSNEVARNTILEYGQFPFWNPFAAGGIPLHANPQSAFLRPAFLFTLIFGCVIGFKIEILVTVIFGMIGMLLLTKYYKMHPAAGILAASIFGLSSFFSLHISEGHATFYAFYLTPYVFLFYLKSFEQLRYAFFSGFFMTLIIFAGGSFNVLPQLSIFLLAYGIFSSIQKRQIKPIICLIGIFSIAFLLGSIKTIPTIEYLIQHPRPIQSDERTDIAELHHIFLYRDQMLGAHPLKIQFWGWHEYGAYTGVFPLIFLMLGLIFLWKQEIPLLLSGVFSFLISLGDFGKFSPWHLMHQLPLLESLHVPSRYIIMVTFSMAIIAGLSINLFMREAEGKKTKYLLLIILFIILVDLISVNTKTFRQQTFPNPPQNVERYPDFKHMRGVLLPLTASSGMYFNFLANRGTLDPYEPVPHAEFAKAHSDPDYKGEVYLDGNGTSSYAYWSPNKLVVDVAVQGETRLVINQNYDKGWHVKGKVAENFNGLLSTNVTSADKTIEFYYLPMPFIIGLLVTLASIISIVILYTKRN